MHRIPYAAAAAESPLPDFCTETVMLGGVDARCEAAQRPAGAWRAVALAVLAASGCSTGEARPRNVLLVSIDTLRADRLGCYGSARPTTPRLDAWVAKQAVVYRDALSTSCWTFPATSSMTTGLAVHQHGMTLFPSSLPEKAQTLAGYLRESGYATYGFVEGSFIGAAVGFHRGYDYYDSGFPESKEPPWERLLPLIRASRGAGPFFVFLHSYLVHAEYPVDNRFEDPRHPYRGWLAGRPIDYASVLDPYLQGALELGEEERAYISRRYDAGVARMDEILGDFFRRLEEALGEEDFLLILTSDHGEELFEHGGVGHGYNLYEEILRVPLIVRFPAEGLRRRVGVEEAPVTMLDIVPTVLDVLGLPVPSYLPGRSLRGPLPEERLRVASMGALSSVRLGTHKLILGEGKTPRWKAQPVELYDLRTDPGERKNLAGERPEIVRRLEEALRRFEAAFPPVGAPRPLESEITGRDLEVLRGLGYVSAPH